MHIEKYIGPIHLAGMMLENVYGYIAPAHYFMDRFYIFSFVTLPISWMICKDECIISYITKIRENPDYIMGSEPNDVKDMLDLFPTAYWYAVFYNTNYILRISSVYIVNHRSMKISNAIIYPTFVLTTIYNYNIKYDIRENFYIKIALFIYVSIIYAKLFLYKN